MLAELPISMHVQIFHREKLLVCRDAVTPSGEKQYRIKESTIKPLRARACKEHSLTQSVSQQTLAGHLQGSGALLGPKTQARPLLPR